VGTNLTTWLLRQEMEHKIDGELAVVLSSVSIACKRVRARYRAINWPPFHLANP
jgi:fructose-1,6-bisphosphatase I